MYRIQDFFRNNIFSNRRNTIIFVMVLMTAILLGRLFTLQIVMGADYADNYRLKIERRETIEATRGNIYDRNGNVLASNKLSHDVIIEDVGNYQDVTQKNESINNELLRVINKIEQNGDKLNSDFGIDINESGQFVFRDEGVSLDRFRADIFGHADITDLKYNSKLEIDEATATADEIMDYLCDTRYEINTDFDKASRFKIARIRYRMGLNTYQKYIATVIASDVSDNTVAYVMENQSDFTGVSIQESMIRVYENAECFSNVLGYTGTISSEEYQKLSETDDSYSLNDIIGKSGLEQYLNDELRGEKGYQVIYVDSLGNLLETAERVEQKKGGDVYLSIDKDLQTKTYYLLEQQIAGILVSKLANIKTFDAEKRRPSEDIIIPIYDVYNALIENKVIDINPTANPTAAEADVYSAFETKLSEVMSDFNAQLRQNPGMAYENLPKEYQTYSTYLVKRLKSLGIFDETKIDDSDPVQKSWRSEKLSVEEYLKYCIEKEWIDTSSLVQTQDYVDTTQMYSELIDYSLNMLVGDNEFKRDVYYYALIQDRINTVSLLLMLYDQGVIPEDENMRSALSGGQISSYEFMRRQIETLNINPGQLGLDPCSGSCVIMEPNGGQVLAMVSYPGYDTNRLANNLDSNYYNYLNTNNSSPMYNHATQEKTAPGSTFKLVSATAGLGESVIDSSTIIEDTGVFTKVSNEPKCWIHPGNHGKINLSHAIGVSCNCYFYEVGYRLAGDENYNDKRGVDKINEYASQFGLSEKTGIEIEESTPQLASQYPVMEAIGQSDISLTTVSLARYVSAIANGGNVFDLSLIIKVTDENGEVIKNYGPTLKNSISALNANGWNTIRYGMKLMVEEHPSFDNFPIEVAGKTGTAEQAYDRPNHALFIGYAPYNNPTVSIATRISFGYASANATEVSKRILAEYFGVGDYDANAGASHSEHTNGVTD